MLCLFCFVCFVFFCFVCFLLFVLFSLVYFVFLCLFCFLFFVFVLFSFVRFVLFVCFAVSTSAPLASPLAVVDRRGGPSLELFHPLAPHGPSEFRAETMAECAWAQAPSWDVGSHNRPKPGYGAFYSCGL